MRAFIEDFKYVEWFDVFLFGSWMLCGFLGGIVITEVLKAYYQ